MNFHVVGAGGGLLKLWGVEIVIACMVYIYSFPLNNVFVCERHRTRWMCVCVCVFSYRVGVCV